MIDKCRTCLYQNSCAIAYSNNTMYDGIKLATNCVKYHPINAK